jgi:hypothetical protein
MPAFIPWIPTDNSSVITALFNPKFSATVSATPRSGSESFNKTSQA